MKIEAQFFSRLRDLAGGSHLELDLPEEYTGRDQVLRAGDSVSVMPPVQGG